MKTLIKVIATSCLIVCSYSFALSQTLCSNVGGGNQSCFTYTPGQPTEQTLIYNNPGPNPINTNNNNDDDNNSDDN